MISNLDKNASLFAALAKANEEITNAAKNADNPYFKSTYADLGSIMDVCRLPLAKNGLSLSHDVKIDYDTSLITIITFLYHSSGAEIHNSITLPCAKQVVSKGAPPMVTAQSVGSTVTYARRYSVSSLLAIATGDDDDGNVASGKQQQPKPKPKQQPATTATAKKQTATGPKLASKKQVGMYKGKLREAYGIEASKQKDMEFKKKFGVDSANDFTSDQIRKLIDGLIDLIKKQGAFVESAPKQQNIGFGEPNFSK